MKKKLAAALALTLAASILTTGGAFAQQPGASRERAPTRGGSEVTEYTFGDHSVDGGPTGPDGSIIRPRLRTRRDTLIQPRVHYVNEMLKSVETL